MGQRRFVAQLHSPCVDEFAGQRRGAHADFAAHLFGAQRDGAQAGARSRARRGARLDRRRPPDAGDLREMTIIRTTSGGSLPVRRRRRRKRLLVLCRGSCRSGRRLRNNAAQLLRRLFASVARARRRGHPTSGCRLAGLWRQLHVRLFRRRDLERRQASLELTKRSLLGELHDGVDVGSPARRRQARDTASSIRRHGHRRRSRRRRRARRARRITKRGAARGARGRDHVHTKIDAGTGSRRRRRRVKRGCQGTSIAAPRRLQLPQRTHGLQADTQAAGAAHRHRGRHSRARRRCGVIALDYFVFTDSSSTSAPDMPSKATFAEEGRFAIGAGGRRRRGNRRRRGSGSGSAFLARGHGGGRRGRARGRSRSATRGQGSAGA